MNTVKKTNTQIKTESFFSNIILKYGHSTFSWDNLNGLDNFSKTEKIAISLAVKTGDLTRVGRGLYALKNLNAEDVAKKCRILSANTCAKLNKQRQQKQVSIPVHNFNNNLTVEICAEFLKARGYKVMKPTTTFQEI